MAFEDLDNDGSESLDQSELTNILHEVSKSMGVVPPSDEDLRAILM